MVASERVRPHGPGAASRRSRQSGRDPNHQATAHAFVNEMVDDAEGNLVSQRIKARVQGQADTEDPAKFAIIGLASRTARECRNYSGDFSWLELLG
jgi:hypothetical protein